MPVRVDDQRTAPERLVRDGLGAPRALPAAPQQGPDAGHQLTGAVRLGHVVVRAEIEPQQQIVLGAAGRQHQHRHFPVLGTEHPHHVQAVRARHHHIEHQEIGLPVPDLGESREAVADDRDRMALVFEVAAYEFGLFLVVFGDYDVCAHADDRRGPRGSRPWSGRATGPT